jgi:hypothetical protein
LSRYLQFRPQEDSLWGKIADGTLDLGIESHAVVDDEMTITAGVLNWKGAAFSLRKARQRQFFMVDGTAGKAPWWTLAN